MDKNEVRNIPLFADLDDSDLQVVTTFSQERSVGEGDVLVREGDYSDEVVVIREGTAEVRRGDEVLAELGPGDIFGEVGVLSGDMRSATIRATGGMRLLVFTTFDFKRVRSLPGMSERIDEVVAARGS